MARSDAAPKAGTRSAFYRMGTFAVRRRWWMVAVWVLALAASFPALGKLADRLSQGGFEVPGSQSDQVRVAVERDFEGQFELNDQLVLYSETLSADDPEFVAAFEAASDALSDAPGVAAISDPYASPEQSISADGHTLVASVGLTDDQDQALEHNPELLRRIHQAIPPGGEIEAYLTGAAPFYQEFSETTTHDLERAEKIALPISLLILVLAFGSLVAAGLPLAMALFGLAISFGLISLLAAATTVSIFTQNIASMIGIGVGIDYSLFVVSRYRHELREGHDVPDAVGRAMATSGKAVMVSALTVVVALSGTLLVNIAAFRSMGAGAMIAVAIAGLAALTLMPALLGFVGKKVDSLHLGRRRKMPDDEGSSRFWHRWALGVMRRPWLALAGSVAVLAILAFPARDLKLGSSGPSIFPPDAEPRIAAETVGRAFGEGQVAPVQVLVRHPDGILAGEGLAAVVATASAASEDPEVVRIDSIATIVAAETPEELQAALAAPEAAPLLQQFVSTDGTTTILRVVTAHGPQSDEAGDLVKRLRARADEVGSGASVTVGGDPALNVDLNDEIRAKMIPVVVMVLIMSFFLLMLFFRSILLPLKAILMNAASVLATYGVLVFIFQNGHFENLLGFEGAGHIESFLPLFLFTILFGLSMDYEVFLLARVREEYLRSNDNTEAVGWGLEHTAKIITSAAAVMVTVFGAFAFASLLPIKSMGFGLATAVFLDATLVRVVLVPATMRLMGKWNWWLPGWLDRILPNVSLEGAPEDRVKEPAPARAGV
ncbi:MAG TPA: MMPL family transporter [Actinomycetota bacterium]